LPRIYLTVGEVLEIHYDLIKSYGGIHGLRDRGLLESAVFRPQIGYYHTIVEEAAALMESLANNHPFLDGNKRIAFAAAYTFLVINGHDLDVQTDVAADFVIGALDRGEFRFGAILNWLAAHLR
jgi:death on curing protein